jgi:hypothetical protein
MLFWKRGLLLFTLWQCHHQQPNQCQSFGNVHTKPNNGDNYAQSPSKMYIFKKDVRLTDVKKWNAFIPVSWIWF